MRRMINNVKAMRQQTMQLFFPATSEIGDLRPLINNSDGNGPNWKYGKSLGEMSKVQENCSPTDIS